MGDGQGDQRAAVRPPVVCLTDVPTRVQTARGQAHRLGLPEVASIGDVAPGRLFLAVTDDAVELRRSAGRGPAARPDARQDARQDVRKNPSRARRASSGDAGRVMLSVDLLAAARQPARQRLTARQPLARAIGSSRARVLDVTAGLGEDAARLAVYGCEVTAVERHPALVFLLDDALQRAADEHGAAGDEPRAAGLSARLHVEHADAADVLSAIERGERPRPDVVCIDPMFPPKRRPSALPPLAAQILRELVGDDPDAGDVLALARRACRRVVVKRPDHAPPLAEPVTASFPGRTVRYDLYTNPHVPRA